MSELFRQQAIGAQKQRLFGSISIAQPLSLSLVTISLFVILASIILFLFLSDYARKETVKGYLKPEKDLIKTSTNRSGVLEHLFIQEGSKVIMGQPLASNTTAQILDSCEGISDKPKTDLSTQQRLLDDQVLQQNRLQAEASLRLKQRICVLEKSLTSLVRQQKLQKEKMVLLLAQQGQDQKLQQENEIRPKAHELIALVDRYGASITNITQQQSDHSRQVIPVRKHSQIAQKRHTQAHNHGHSRR